VLNRFPWTLKGREMSMSQLHAGVNTYANEKLAVGECASLEPVFENDVLTGLILGRVQIPRPLLGLEHEFNIAARLALKHAGGVDSYAIGALLEATDQLGGQLARSTHTRQVDTVFDRGRRIKLVAGLPVHFYDDCSKFEVAFGVFTDAKKVIAFECQLAKTLREIAAVANGILTDRHGVEPQLMIHLSGGDGISTCASLHLNIPWYDPVAEAAYETFEAFPQLCEHLARQVVCAASVGANGWPSVLGWRTNSRAEAFDRIVGPSTVRPSRAMQFTRLTSRSSEGYDRPEVGRNMAMCYVWGQSQVANFLTLVLAQIEAVRFHLAVCGWHSSPVILEGTTNPLTLVRTLGSNPQAAGALMLTVLDDYWHFCERLENEIGAHVVAQLVPHYAEALKLGEKVARAIVTDDTDVLIRCIDRVKKEFLLTEVLGERWRTHWRECFTQIRNLCFAFSSPQAMSPYYDFFLARGIEQKIVDEAEIDLAGPDELTRSWFFAEVARRFWDDPAMQFVSWDWDNIRLTSVVPISAGWIPQFASVDKKLDLSNPFSHNAVTHRHAVENVRNLVELFMQLGKDEQPVEKHQRVISN